MRAPQAAGWTRRRFLGGLTLAGAAQLLGLYAMPVAAEPPPETTTLRMDQRPSICVAPQYVAEELLRGEGFTEVQYLKKQGPKEIEPALAAGEVDMAMHFVAPNVIRVDVGDPIVMLAAGHVGCFELFGTDQVRTIRDLKGKAVAVTELGGPGHVFIASMVAYVGLDPRKDIHWVTHPLAQAVRLLAEGKVDALLAFPPGPQELRTRQIGHVVVNSMMDRPWSQYFCCMVTGNREFVRKHPVATKRVLRALLRAADLCTHAPEHVAQFLIDRGYATNYDYALQLLKEIPYGEWHEYDPEDTVRFYALRLQEAGMIKSTPQKIIAQGTDWRFLNELKKELKG